MIIRFLPPAPEGLVSVAGGGKPPGQIYPIHAPRSGAVYNSKSEHNSTTTWRVDGCATIPGAYTPGYGHVAPTGQGVQIQKMSTLN